MRLKICIGDILEGGETIKYQVSRSRLFDIKFSNLYLDGNVSVEGWLQDSVAKIRILFVLEAHELQILDQSL
jgi:hypothetical protein